MQSLNQLFGESPFKHMVDHVRKIHQCVKLIRPIAEAIARIIHESCGCALFLGRAA